MLAFFSATIDFPTRRIGPFCLDLLNLLDQEIGKVSSHVTQRLTFAPRFLQPAKKCVVVMQP